jgi:hypothetical protein
MSSFTIRVELYGNPPGEVYEVLHKAMGAEGFSRTITSNEGIEYHLPTAEYYITGLLTRPKVRAKANSAAAKTGKKYAVLVTESNGTAWSGLKPV